MPSSCPEVEMQRRKQLERAISISAGETLLCLWDSSSSNPSHFYGSPFALLLGTQLDEGVTTYSGMQSMDTGCFQYLAIINNVTVNTWCLSPDGHVGNIPKSGISEQWDVCI